MPSLEHLKHDGRVASQRTCRRRQVSQPLNVRVLVVGAGMLYEPLISTLCGGTMSSSILVTHVPHLDHIPHEYAGDLHGRRSDEEEVNKIGKRPRAESLGLAAAGRQGLQLLAPSDMPLLRR